VGLNQLEQRIQKGVQRIDEARATGKTVTDWEKHLKKLHQEYTENLLGQALDEIKTFYIPGLYKWIENNEQGLINDLFELENKLTKLMINEKETELIKQSLEDFKDWHYRAIAAYKAKSNQGGNTDMALIVKAPIRRLVDEGVYPANVLGIEEQEDELFGGERIVFTFELEHEANDDGSPVHLTAYCSKTLSPKSKLRKFAEVIMSTKFSKDQAENGVDLEGLVGLPCQVGIVHNESKDGSTYAKVETLYPPQKG